MIEQNNIYLAMNDSKIIEYNLDFESNYEEELTIKSNNNNIVEVVEFNKALAKNVGSTTIELKIKDEVRIINVVVTDLINNLSNNYDKRKNARCFFGPN